MLTLNNEDHQNIKTSCVEFYSQLDSYQDDSTAKTIKFTSNGDKKNNMSYSKMYYKDGNKLWFQWKDVSEFHNMGWNYLASNGQTTYTKMPYMKLRKENNLEMALATLQGVSGGKVNFIPSLLLKHSSLPYPLFSKLNIKIICKGILNNIPCHILIAEHRNKEDYQAVWIEEKQFKIRKLEQKHTTQINEAAQIEKTTLEVMKIAQPEMDNLVKGLSPEESDEMKKLIDEQMKSLDLKSMIKDMQPTKTIERTYFSKIKTNHEIPDTIFDYKNIK